jgi:hypothetical protein
VGEGAGEQAVEHLHGTDATLLVRRRNMLLRRPGMVCLTTLRLTGIMTTSPILILGAAGNREVGMVASANRGPKNTPHTVRNITVCDLSTCGPIWQSRR